MTQRDAASGRTNQHLRPVSMETGITRYAEGSVLVRFGNTHVLCNASVEESVPKWLDGKGSGWITAEYAMLPRATHTRTQRDREKVSGRTQEIQRLIARALRACVDLKRLGQRQIIVDCDVLQADGGTRTAAITGGCVALALALEHLVKKKAFSQAPWKGSVAAVSVGIKSNSVLVDLDYQEDSSCDVDMNFVVLGSDQLVEVQGTAEGHPFDAQMMSQMTAAALGATQELQRIQAETLRKAGISWAF